MLDNINNKTNVLLVSDHGFGPHRKKFYLNSFIMQLGLLRKKQLTTASLLRRIGLTKEGGWRLLSKLSGLISLEKANTGVAVDSATLAGIQEMYNSCIVNDTNDTVDVDSVIYNYLEKNGRTTKDTIIDIDIDPDTKYLPFFATSR